jgi:hypothetical protein
METIISPSAPGIAQKSFLPLGKKIAAKARPAGGALTTVTKMFIYKGQEVTYFQLDVSSKVAKDLENALTSYIKDPGHYSLLGQTCTSVAVNAMVVSGIKINGGPMMDPGSGHQIPGGTGMSPNELKEILNSPYNANLVDRKIKFVVGQ